MMIETSYAAVILIAILVVYLLRRKRHITLQNVHCMITGGSSGIGLAIAVQVARLGGNVSIIARSKDRLASAKTLITTNAKNSNQKVLTFSADVAHYGAALDDIVEEAEKEAGPINFLVNCAGTSVCYSFLETPVDDFKRMMDLNYLGSVYMTRAVLPSMQEQKCGTIVFVSSIAGLMGLYGYTAYSASKFALLGLAESLQMEVKPYKINVSVAFPPDTDTPGFAEEIKNKPIETVRISESAGLYSAEHVATTILENALNKKFMSTVGFDGYVLSVLCCGMTPINSFFNLVMQVMTMGIFRLASVYLWFQFNRIIQKCAVDKQKLQKDDKYKAS